MQEVGYLDLESHKALHRAFYGHIQMWNAIVDAMRQANSSFHVGNIFVMVAKWLQDHVCVTDKLVGAFVEKQVINGNTTPDGVDDVMPDCVPDLVGRQSCVSLVQGVQTGAPAPKWWAPLKRLQRTTFGTAPSSPRCSRAVSSATLRGLSKSVCGL